MSKDVGAETIFSDRRLDTMFKFAEEGCRRAASPLQLRTLEPQHTAVKSEIQPWKWLHRTRSSDIYIAGM